MKMLKADGFVSANAERFLLSKKKADGITPVCVSMKEFLVATTVERIVHAVETLPRSK